MTDKDPKDMTASELLRSGGSSFFNTLADKIDAEIAQARADGISEGIDASLRQGAEAWAKANGWPDFRDGEDFGAWLDRCAYKKPVDDCNEPVQFGDEIELHFSGGGMEEGRFQEVNLSNGPIMILSFTGTDHERLYRYDSECDTIKRPAPEVLGADGLPIKAGETVYRLSDGERLEVLLPHGSTPETYEYVDCCGELEYPSNISHTPPDTQSKIDEDTEKHYCAYFGGYGACDTCPANIDGLSVNSCARQQLLDLLRRQRELDKRTGGDA